MKRGKQISVVVPLKDGNYVMLNFHRGVDGIYIHQNCNRRI